MAFHRDDEDASEVWSRVTERLWAGLDRFGWHSSFRTWIYAIARNTSIRYRQEKKRRNEEALPEGSQGDIGVRIRTDTASWLRTSARDRFAALRDSLPEAARLRKRFQHVKERLLELKRVIAAETHGAQ